MAMFRVEIRYRTKNYSVCSGMNIEADCIRSAISQGCDTVFTQNRNRIYVSGKAVIIDEKHGATEDGIVLNVVEKRMAL
jgi:hypothetical protein